MFFPPIQDTSVSQYEVVFTNLRVDPKYLDNPECTYSELVKDFFRKHALGAASVGGSIFDGKERSDAIEDQIGELIKDLNDLAGQLKSSDHSERLQYYKTKASLIEKLISMRERTHNLKEVSEFQSLVMGFLDDLCTKEQISQLLKRLGHLPSLKELS